MDFSKLFFFVRLARDKLLGAQVDLNISILMFVELRVDSFIYFLMFWGLLITPESKYFKRKTVLCCLFLSFISEVIEFSVSLSL